MKCQHCEKPATFHITELTDPGGPQILHLCEEHARAYLSQEPTTPLAAVAGALAKQLKLGQSAEELAKLDQKECPVCGITFFEFRNAGRLGCPYDYTAFRKDLEPLLVNIHDAREHRGKRPRRMSPSVDRQAELIRLRREMEEAVELEEYERASEIRDRIRQFESGEPPEAEPPPPAEAEAAKPRRGRRRGPAKGAGEGEKGGEGGEPSGGETLGPETQS